MKTKKKKIEVTKQNGVYRVSADFENGFQLIPSQHGNMKLAFWDEERMKLFLKSFGFYPVISHSAN